MRKNTPLKKKNEMEDKIIRKNMEKFGFDKLEGDEVNDLYLFSKKLLEEYFLENNKLNKEWEKQECSVCEKRVNLLEDKFIISIWEKINGTFSRNTILCSWDCLNKLKFRKLKK